MTNTELLKEEIKKSGLHINYLSDKCGLSRAGFYKKMNGLTDFTATEIGTLRSELNLTLTQTKNIFFI